MDIIWFAEIKWDYLKTRKQQIITRKPDDIRLLFIEPYVKGRPNRYSVRSEGDILCATIPFVKSVTPGPVRWALDRRMVRSWIDQAAYMRTRRILSRLRFDRVNPGCILSNIHAIHVATRIPRSFLLYDCNDAHAAFPGMPEWSREYFTVACRRADVVFASSHELMDSIATERSCAEGIEYIGNGVEFKRFQSGAQHERAGGASRRVEFGYLGAVAPWFDFSTLELLAVRHPEWNIALVGPVLGGAQEELARLAKLPNVTHSPAVPHEEVPSVLKDFSVALIPFRYGELTRGVNPNKLYEYMAAGLPVVATRFCRDVQAYPEVVRTAEPGESFMKACEDALQAVSADSRGTIATEAKRIAKDHDWDGIADNFWSKVRHMMEARHE